MSEAIIDLDTLDDIGEAIQYVEDSDDTYTPGQMAEVIRGMKRTIIPGTFTSNGEYSALLDDADAYNPVTVAVPQPEGTININQNGTVDVTQYASANVQVPGSSAVIQPLSVSQNGTYNPPAGVDGFAPVKVQVSGGGGNAEIKVVNVINSGNKLIEFEIPRLENDVSGLGIINPVDCYISNEDSCIYADNSEANKDQTIYAVVKSLETGGNYQGVSSGYSNNAGNFPNIFTTNSTWVTSTYGSDTSTGVTSTVFHVLTIAIGATAKTCSYYIDGVAYGTKTFYNCGRYPSIGAGTINGTNVLYSGDMAIRYGAIVSETHDSATVIANHQLIMQRYAGEIGT